jgi:hypothetical protein
LWSAGSRSAARLLSAPVVCWRWRLLPNPSSVGFCLCTDDTKHLTGAARNLPGLARMFGGVSRQGLPCRWRDPDSR